MIKEIIFSYEIAIHCAANVMLICLFGRPDFF
jgi:hypothetical protein